MNESPALQPAMNVELTFVYSVTHGYIHRIEDRFGPGIRFDPSGLARAACVFGWITGIGQGGNIAFANTLAEDFVRNLDYLANYGGTRVIESPYRVEVPAYVVKVSDDGTSHGFSLLWYMAELNSDQAKDNVARGRRIETFDRRGTPYAASFNGGLLYHGPGGQENFSVSLTDKYWGIHT